MNESKESILSVLRREPERSDLIIKFGLGMPVAIVVWDWAGGLILPFYAVLPITLGLVLAYAITLAYLVARVIHGADRYEAESTVQARRMLSNTRHLHPAARLAASPSTVEADAEAGDDDDRPEPEPAVRAATPARAAAAPPAPPPAPSSDFQRIYFLLRLQDQVKQARRDGHDLCVIVLDLTVPGQDLTPALAEKISFDLAHMAANQTKTISHSVSVSPTEFVFCLPGTDYNEAKSFVSKLVQALGDYWCHFGIARYPRDGTDAEALVEVARNECDNSRQDRPSSRSRVPVFSRKGA
jgi:hypothetical protein